MSFVTGAEQLGNGCGIGGIDEGGSGRCGCRGMGAHIWSFTSGALS